MLSIIKKKWTKNFKIKILLFLINSSYKIVFSKIISWTSSGKPIPMVRWVWIFWETIWWNLNYHLLSHVVVQDTILFSMVFDLKSFETTDPKNREYLRTRAADIIKIRKTRSCRRRHTCVRNGKKLTKRIKTSIILTMRLYFLPIFCTF